MTRIEELEEKLKEAQQEVRDASHRIDQLLSLIKAKDKKLEEIAAGTYSSFDLDMKDLCKAMMRLAYEGFCLGH